MARFARISVNGAPHFAEVIGERLVLLDDAPWRPHRRTEHWSAIGDAQWLPPTAASKVVAIGQNYRKHAQEMGKAISDEPLLFIKPSTALNPHGAAIVLPPASHEVHHEAELGLIISRSLTRASEDEAREAIFGLTCANDVTARDIQRREIQHTRAKSYDTFMCCGPFIQTGVSFDDLRVVARVNGVIRQDGRTSDMVHSPVRLVSFISHVMTLLEGDIVITGTPSGVGPLIAGDEVEVEIDGVGCLRNVVSRL